MAAQRYGIDRLGTVILARGDDVERLEEDQIDEEALTNALVRLTSGVTRTVCFTTGHEERRVDDEDLLGLAAVTFKLTQQGTVVKPIQVLRDGGVPADCDTVVVADPQVEPVPQERSRRHTPPGGGIDFLLFRLSRMPRRGI